jgi:hypothetical protein
MDGGFDDDLTGDTARHTDVRSEQAQDQRTALPHNLNVTPEAQAHRHEAMQRRIRAIDMPHDPASARRELIKPVTMIHGLLSLHRCSDSPVIDNAGGSAMINRFWRGLMEKLCANLLTSSHSPGIAP